VDELIQMWSKGQLKSGAVQRLAMKAHMQGTPDIEGLGAIGNFGENPQNLFRAMRTLLGWPTETAPISWIELPTKRGRNTPWPALFPHHLLQHLGEEQFMRRLVGNRNAPKTFWENMRESAYVRDHPNLPEALWRKVIPVGIHGDGGSFTKQDSVMVLSWNSLCSGYGPTLDTRLVFTVIRKADCVADTIDKLLEALAWSFNTALRGETPSENWVHTPLSGGGQPLRDGYRLAACQVRGDWEFFSDVFHLPRWNTAVNMCPFCRASSTIRHLAWTQVGEFAPWRGTLWDHTARMDFLRAAGLAIPILFLALIGFRLECIHIDVLHTVDQGTASHIVGNTMWHMAVVKRCFGGTTQGQNIENLAKRLKTWYQNTRCNRRLQGNLTLERVRTSGKWPKLKGKAAATRHIVKFCVYIMEEYGDGSDADNDVLNLCKMMQRFYDILDAESQFLSDGAKIELPILSRTLCGLYAKLSIEAFAAGVRMWKMNPKLHLFQHLCEYMVLFQGNPKYFWTYQDESLVGDMIELCQSVHVSTLAVSALFKWIHIVFGIRNAD
jgi:hypothetical protein